MEGDTEVSVMEDDSQVSLMEGDSVEATLSEGRRMAAAWEAD